MEFLAVACSWRARDRRDRRRGGAVTVVSALAAAALPYPLAPAIYPGELALGVALYGLLTALTFAVAPLGRAHDLPVSALFRDHVAEIPPWPRPRYLAAAAAILGGVLLALVAISASPQRTVAIVVVVATALALVALRLVAWAAMGIARRAPRARVGRVAHGDRQPAPSGRADTLRRHIAGAGTGGARHAGARGCEPAWPSFTRAGGATPSFYFLDVRSGEITPFLDFSAAEAPGASIAEAPMMRGRIVRSATCRRSVQSRGERRLGFGRRPRCNFRGRAAAGLGESSRGNGGREL